METASETPLDIINQREQGLTEEIQQRSIIIARLEQQLNLAVQEQVAAQGALSELRELRKIFGKHIEGERTVA